VTTNGHRELTQPQIDALWHNQTQAEHGITLCRQALAEAKRSCCPHGVPWHHCHQHNPNDASSEETE
jgi:hypothetical protein